MVSNLLWQFSDWILELFWWSGIFCFSFYLKFEGPSGSWSYRSWIYNYLCNQWLLPLTLCVRIPLRRCVLDTTLCAKVCQWLTNRSVFFSGYSSFLPRYNWNIVESGVKLHSSTPFINNYWLFSCDCLLFLFLHAQQMCHCGTRTDYMALATDPKLLIIHANVHYFYCTDYV